MSVAVAEKITRILSVLDALGATYRAIPGHPGWYEARWPAPGLGFQRWTCRDAPDDRERIFALAFRERCNV